MPSGRGSRSGGGVAAASGSRHGEPDDLIALESLGEVLGRLGRPAEGLAAYKRAISQSPTRQTALEGAGFLSFKAGRNKDAIEFWKQAINVNPWRSDYHAELAAAALRLRDWRAAPEPAGKPCASTRPGTSQEMARDV